MVVDGEKVKRREVGLENVEDHNLHFFLSVCMYVVRDRFLPFFFFHFLEYNLYDLITKKINYSSLHCCSKI